MNKYFDFIYNHVNLLILVDIYDDIWFCANDVARILEYRSPIKAINSLVPTDYKKKYNEISVTDKKYTKQYPENTFFINEIGLYRLSIRSKQPKAREFQDWITDVVLPSIRKEGIFRLEKKIKYMKKTNDALLREIDYLRGSKEIKKKGAVYILESPSIVRGKKKICYKLGMTKNIANRMRTYRTGNPNAKMVKIIYTDTLDPRAIERCGKAILKIKELKKNNEIFCTSLKGVEFVLNKCIEGYKKIM